MVALISAWKVCGSLIKARLGASARRTSFKRNILFLADSMFQVRAERSASVTSTELSVTPSLKDHLGQYLPCLHLLMSLMC